MDFHTINPGHFKVSMLLKLGPEDIHELACRAVAVLTTYRLVVGRCLLAMHQSKGYRKHGCSSAIHYASAILGMSVPVARECRRVAKELQGLPHLTEAAELGTVEWSKLREIVRRAVPGTELYWLRLAEKHSYREIEVLVGRTPKGSIPGEVDHQGDGYRSELRCAAGPSLFAMLDQMRRVLSMEKDEVVTTAEVLELALTSLMTSQPFEPGAVEQAREAADKDVQAQQARLLPVVFEARELALKMGLLEPDEAESLEASLENGLEDEQEFDMERGLVDKREDVGGINSFVRGPAVRINLTPKSPARVIAEALYRADSSADSGPASAPRGGGSTLNDGVRNDGVRNDGGAPVDSGVGGRSNMANGGALVDGGCLNGGVGDGVDVAVNGALFDMGYRDSGVGGNSNSAINSNSNITNGGALVDSMAQHGTPAAKSRPTKDPRQSRAPRGLRFNPVSRSRGPSKGQRQELLRRDGWACRTPGCPNNVWLHLHHLHEYAKGGFTTPHNLLCLCAGCHRNVHRGYLKILQQPDGGLLYTNAEGKPLGHQADLTLATWLDFHLGWSGRELDSHQARHWRGEWRVFATKP